MKMGDEIKGEKQDRKWRRLGRMGDLFEMEEPKLYEASVGNGASLRKSLVT
jgi:hypothetical protein